MFRITPFSAAQTTIFQNRAQASRLSKLQFQASSGLKYSRPSENPMENRTISRLNRTLESLATQQSRINDVQQPLNNSVTNLIEANDLLTRAKQIALEAPQSINEGAQEVLAAELDSIINRLQSIGNSQYQDRYLYSGAAGDTEPFQILDNAGLAIPFVAYGGSSQNAESVISQSISIETAFSGAEIFMQRGRGATMFIGNTGAASGAGTDSEIGRANLTVSHTLTTFSGGSGVAAGVDSAEGDTIIGVMGQHQLTLTDTSGTGTSGTVSLDGGPSVAWTSADTNLKLTGLHGGAVFIDTTAIAAGFSGNVDIEAAGTLSTDGGATETVIDFSNNQVVENSITGNVTHIDSSGVAYAGVESLEYEGTADAFTALLELRDDLQNTRGLDSADLSESLERRFVDLQRASDQILNVVGEQSVALQQLDQMAVQNENQQLDLSSRLSDVGSADLAKVIVEMQGVQTTMQFNYAALSIVQSNNLLDFLG